MDWVVTPYVVSKEDTDMMGVVWYGRYAYLCDKARSALIAAAGYGRFRECMEEGWTLPVTGFDLQVLRPLRKGDEVDLLARVREVKGTRFAFEFEIRLKETRQTATRASTVHYFADPATLAPIRPPDGKWRRYVRDHGA